MSGSPRGTVSAPAVDAPLFWRPEDLPRWSRWQQAQWPLTRRAAHGVRTARAAARRSPAAPEAGLRVLLPTGEVHTLVAVESAGPTQRAALVAPVEALADGRASFGGDTPDAGPRLLDGIAWVMPAEVAERLAAGLPGGAGLTAAAATDDDAVRPRLTGLRRVLVAGEYLPAGRAAVRWARERGAEVAVVQHGLLAVSTPPVPQDATLYAFTSADAHWWTQGRADVEAVPVGSALLEQARRTAPALSDAGDDGPGVFLGQLHGAELPRRDFAAAAEQYVRATGAAYRPHPAERDRLSRGQHAAWRRAGVRIDDAGTPLIAARGPVAAVFSTGILEAAQAGRPAWAVHPDPPAWLLGFWDRYGITRWTPGAEPTPTPPLASPTADPAAAIAADLWKETA